MTNMIDISGHRYGRWLVLKTPPLSNSKGRVYWECKCDCGKVSMVSSRTLRGGESKSCGCLQKELIANRMRQHGLATTTEYRSWNGMVLRCHGKHQESQRHYWGRGIKVCPEWRESFIQFLSDMGEKPNKTDSIDRIDNDGDYSPSNCRWADAVTQNRNTTRTVWITYRGVRKRILEWAEVTGINISTLRSRIRRGWPASEMLGFRGRHN